MNSEFQDVLLKGKIESTKSLKEEMKNKRYPTLPRLCLYFGKKSFVRLNLLSLNSIKDDLDLTPR